MPVIRPHLRPLTLAAAIALSMAAPAQATFPGINGDLAYDAPEGGLATLRLSGMPDAVNAVGRPVAIGAAGPSARDVSWSADATWITYASDVSGDSEVYRLDVAKPGSTPQRLTASPGFDGDPSPSADGRSIAFVSGRAGTLDVWVMDADGANPRPLTSDRGVEQHPQYAPADRRIAYSSDRSGDYELYVVNDDGTGTARLTDDPATDVDPSWSPDGTRLAYAAGDVGATDIHVLRPGADAPPDLITTDSSGYRHPTWSPDGNQLAFHTSSMPGRLVVADAVRTRDVPVPTGRAGAFADWGVLRPVPAGTRPPRGTARVAAAPAVRFRLPGADSSSPLGGDFAYSIPVGTFVDAQPEGKRLRVHLDMAVNRKGPVLETTVTGGVYTLRRRKKALDLEMASLDGCPSGKSAGAAARKRNDVKIRRRRGRGGVRTRHRRRHVTTFTVDTEYRVTETCDRMRIRVLDGRLRVTRTKGRLPGGGKRVTLRKGQRVTIR